MNYSKLIYEVYEKENPELVAAIKLAVKNGESRTNFVTFLRSVFKDYNTSLTASASLTIFDYLKSITH